MATKANSVLDLEGQLGFYRAYHSDPVNVAIHMVFIPLILLSALLLSTNVTLSWLIVPFLPEQYIHWAIKYANLGVLGGVGYGVFYCLLDPLYGIPSLAALVLVTLKETDWTWSVATHDFANKAAMIVFVTGWVAQFAGHGVFEKRAPALFDSLVQALVLAPFFVVFEMAALLGFRKEVLERIDERIRPELEAFHASKKKKAF